MRLNAWLARAGVASRRGADELIKSGRVTVNGEPGQLNTFVESRDRVDKYADYEAGGVREYWMIDPDEEELLVHALDPSGRFRRVEAVEGRVDSAVIPGFFLREEWLWQSPLPSKRAVLREMGLNA